MGSKTESMSPLLTVKQVAEMLGVTTSTVWRWRDAKEIPMPIEIGGTLRWRRAEIEKWIAEK